MEYRKLWLIGVAFALLAGFSMALAIWQSHHLYKIVSESTQLRARMVAQSAALHVSADLDRPFNDLYYISNALHQQRPAACGGATVQRGPGADTNHPGAGSRRRRHPDSKRPRRSCSLDYKHGVSSTHGTASRFYTAARAFASDDWTAAL